jgi:SAM-dependent methyltransferase
VIRRDCAYFVDCHLRTVPVHRALIRAAEATLFAGVDLPRPLLDVGCGDGHFGAMVRAEPIDAGIDLNPGEVAQADQQGIYRGVAVASGAALPFPDEAFASVMSNCVLEHIPPLDETLGEISRVLRPGGAFVTSVPSPNFARFLLGATVPRALGLPAAGEAYGRWFNRISRHYHTDSLDVWRARLDAVGLDLVRWRGYLSQEAMWLFDLSHYYGAPTLLSKRLFGRWVLWPDKLRYWPPERWLAKRLVRYGEEDPGAEAAYLFLVCRKRSPKGSQPLAVSHQQGAGTKTAEPTRVNGRPED